MFSGHHVAAAATAAVVVVFMDNFVWPHDQWTPTKTHLKKSVLRVSDLFSEIFRNSFPKWSMATSIYALSTNFTQIGPLRNGISDTLSTVPDRISSFFLDHFYRPWPRAPKDFQGSVPPDPYHFVRIVLGLPNLFTIKRFWIITICAEAVLSLILRIITQWTILHKTTVRNDSKH